MKRECSECEGEGAIEVQVGRLTCDPLAEVKSVRCHDCDGTGSVTAICEMWHCANGAKVDCATDAWATDGYDERYLCAEHHAQWLAGFDDLTVNLSR